MPEKLPPKKKSNPRTILQNRALHLYFTQMADLLNEHGLDMRKVLKPGVDIQWTSETVKEYLWRPVQKAQLLKKSTTELTTAEIDKVYETLNFHIGNFGVHVPFPSYKEILNKLRLQKPYAHPN